MNTQEYFTLFAVLQGSLVLGVTVYICSYYLPTTRKRGDDHMSWYLATITGSYALLTMATVVTVALKFYKWQDLWYWLITIAYISGDISIIAVFKGMVRHTKQITMADTQLVETHEVEKPVQVKGEIVYGAVAFKLLTPRILAKVTKSIRYFCVGLMTLIAGSDLFSGQQSKTSCFILGMIVLATGAIDMGIGVKPDKDTTS